MSKKRKADKVLWLVGWWDQDKTTFPVVDEDYGWARTEEEAQAKCDWLNRKLPEQYEKEATEHEARNAANLALYNEKMLDHAALIAGGRPSPLKSGWVGAKYWAWTSVPSGAGQVISRGSAR